MSQFSLSLQTALESANLSQTSLCDTTGISPSAMSKYVSGDLTVGRKIAGKIVHALPAPQNGQVLAAFARDQLPDGLADLVTILTPGRVGDSSPDPIPSREVLNGKARELIGYFAHRMSDPALYEMLASTRRALEAT